jgi:hypothetical protein
MSTLEEERKRREEEIKRRLRSKVIPPLLAAPKGREPESGKAPEPEARPILRPKPSINPVIGVEERPHLLKLPQHKPPTVKPRIPAPKESEETVTKKIGVSVPKTAQALDEAKVKLEPKILRAQLPLPSEAPAPVPEISMKGPEISLKPLRPIIEPKPIEERVPEIIISVAREPAPLPTPLTPKRLIESGEKKGREEVGESAGIPQSPEGHEKEEVLPPEEIFIPPLINELSFATKLIGRPVCIILPKKEDDSFVDSVAIICREIYRIVKGGKPSPRLISKGLKEEIEGYLKAEGMIFIIDDSKSELLPDLGKIRSSEDLFEKVNIEMILDRLRELFSQDFGFIIFHVNKRWASQFANLLREKVGYLADIIEVQVPDWQPQVKATLARACWGFIEGKGNTFDEIFGHCEKEFLDKLKKAKEDVELSHYINKDRNASPEHEAMKAIVVECLARDLGASNKHEVIRMLKEKEIETEHELDGGRADIYVRSQRRCVEIETFYGTGDPIDKLDEETLRKYLNLKELKKREYRVDYVDVVLLTGVHALLYAHRLAKLAKIYHEQHHLKVNFYLPDLKEKKLISLRNVLHMLRESVGLLKPAIPTEPAILTEDDIKRLWNEFSEKLHEHGVDPEKYRKRFEGLINRFKSYQENRDWILEEVKKLIETENTKDC